MASSLEALTWRSHHKASTQMVSCIKHSQTFSTSDKTYNTLTTLRDACISTKWIKLVISHYHDLPSQEKHFKHTTSSNKFPTLTKTEKKMNSLTWTKTEKTQKKMVLTWTKTETKRICSFNADLLPNPTNQANSPQPYCYQSLHGLTFQAFFGEGQVEILPKVRGPQRWEECCVSKKPAWEECSCFFGGKKAFEYQKKQRSKSYLRSL